MTNSASSASARERLIQVLAGIAMYNDKGCDWNGHSYERIVEEQHKAQAEIGSLLSEIGEQAIPQDLLSELHAGCAARDASGIYKQRVEQCLSHS